MIGHRRAAVALYELHELDRNWILDALSESDRAALTRLLAELKELGFSRDDALSADSLVAADEQDQPSAVEVIRGASVSILLTVLEEEPDTLIARFLQLEDWPFKEAYLQALGARAQGIRKIEERHIYVAPAADTFILNEVARRLIVISKDNTQEPAPKHSGIGMRVYNWLRNQRR